MHIEGCNPVWSIVLPYYNETAFIGPTIAAAIAQRDVSFRLILVDNASTDGSEALCRSLLAEAPHIDVLFVHERRPGPSHALKAGFDRVETPLVALWNADTWYPADYLFRAEAMLRRPGIVAAMAIDLPAPPTSFLSRLRCQHKRLASTLMSRQAHTGTFGQSFHTDALRAAGGPRSEAWPWVLDDHELMQRVHKIGRSCYRADHVCLPSDRRGHNTHVRWTLFERLLYHATPFALKDWFFYDFLAARFRARGMANANLRERDWIETPTATLSQNEPAPHYL
ncbi:glycosyltransferase family 2 protein [Sphingomonas sp. GB1N7]|uniref:glycosyltransferase family 2 protein n=1 Tax=Parasphingomonas caseinilytica TaxID=3096158 RepID=UPI002FC702FA